MIFAAGKWPPPSGNVTAMRRAKRAPTRFASPGTVVCSWMTIGSRRAAAARTTGSATKPPVANTTRGRSLARRRGARDARGDAHGEVDDVLPRPVAAELAGRDREVGDGALGRAPGLDARPRADPGARDRALAQDGGDGEAGARVAAGPTPGDHDLTQHDSFRAGDRARARSGARAARRSRARRPPTSARTRSSR